jgi:hypothetical protein
VLAGERVCRFGSSCSLAPRAPASPPLSGPFARSLFPKFVLSGLLFCRDRFLVPPTQ